MIYKMSKLAYKLANGNMVNTLEKAKESKQEYKIEYLPVYENLPVTKKRKKKL